MSFVVSIDSERWNDNIATVSRTVAAVDDARLVPVVKGNGYGLGQQRIVDRATHMGVDTIAIGTVYELAETDTSTDVLVLEPFEPRDKVAAQAWWNLGDRADRVIRTVSSLEALLALAAGPGRSRVVLEALTSTRRFGFDEPALLVAINHPDVRAAIARGVIVIEGIALHLPIAEPPRPKAKTGGERTLSTPKVDEVVSWAGLWDDAIDVWPGDTAALRSIWLSHVSYDELSLIRRYVPDLTLRPRIGTDLWLGDRSALKVTGTVLAVHPLAAQTPVGYRQRTGPKDGTLVVISGGTSHGIGLTAPSSLANARARVVTAGTGILDATGRALSPFSWQGKQRWFAEPPHMHVSLLWLPRDCVIPAVGDVMPADVRFTTSRFDAVLGLD